MRKFLRKSVPVLVMTTLVATGCSFGANEATTEMDAPPVSYVDEGDSLDLDEEGDAPETEEPAKGEEAEPGEENVAEEEVVTSMVERELYLIDENGLVVPQTLSVPKTESVLKQSLQYLVDGGPVTELLPNGFKAVIPAGTEVDVHLVDGVAIADFSNEFKEYNPEHEQQILQAITWTLTQFETVEKVTIRINGYDQDMMPQNGTPIGEGVSRANGINLESNGVVDLVNSKSVTLYFLDQKGDNTYYVPVTRRVGNSEDALKVAVEELLQGPSFKSNLLTDFRNGVQLLSDPIYENGVVTLNFNESLLSQLDARAISDIALNMLALTLTEQEGVEQVAVQVNGEANILHESGQMAQPVTRPEKVNTGSF
ncbi:GerMN domain-containing protein [Bacillus sp. FJAT-45037]|uniref:GerMN domain-containing protein n=1 Tax=Bacillus sp. FJAT-45037 TaxID=2011007 RepID=UPI000C237B69|nr:GerMN domain-containing protein [Bacillus sp. FJAT-45037]